MKDPIRVAGCAVPLLLVAFGCGPETGVSDPAIRADGIELSLASDRFSDWSSPVNLGPVVNSSSVENAPELSKDGLSLYFGSNRPGGQGGQDLYVSQRPSPDAAWETPVNLGPVINSSSTDVGAHLSRDGHWLFFSSSRPGGSGSADVWVSQRKNIHDDFAWEEPVNLGVPLNSSRFEGAVSTWGPELYLWRGTPDPASAVAPTDGDIYLSETSGQTFSEPTLVTELSSPAHEQRPSIRFDGQEIFFSSSRPVVCVPAVACLEDLWTSVRQGNGQAWQHPVNLGPVVNSSSRDTQASLSEDGTMLFFLSDRQGPAGNLDIYVTTRSLKGE